MADDARNRRAAALEEKKRRLEALKARRSIRQAPPATTTTTGTSTSSVSVGVGSNNGATKGGGGDLDEYIDGLLANKAPIVPSSAAATADDQIQTEKKTKEEEDSSMAAKESNAEKKATDETSDGQTAKPASDDTIIPVRKKVETFEISTQTEEDDFPPASVASSASEEEDDDDGDKSPIDTKSQADIMEEEGNEDGTQPMAILSQEEKSAALSSAPFSSFFTTASKKVERLLGASLLEDLLVDANYAGAEDDDGLAAMRNSGTNGLLSSSSRAVFECARWTGSRSITDIDWSPVHKELMLVGYHMPNSTGGLDGTASRGSGASTSDFSGAGKMNSSSFMMPRNGEQNSDGLALVWSLAMPSRPEHIFTCNSPVLGTKFHPTEHHLIIGGCHTGQIVVWDLRAGRLPVQRSSLTVVAGGASSGMKGHAHPISAVEIAEGGSGLVTASTDGRINFWSLANLRDPAESYQLNGNTTSLAVTPESNSILCGDESGGLHAILPQSSASGSAGAGGVTTTSARSSMRRVLKKFDVSEAEGGHFGMLTAVSTRQLSQTSSSSQSRAMSRGFLRGGAGLVLTSGVDWTTKLWAPAYTDRPLLSFMSSSYDYMCDVQWSPTNPSVFATASSNGTMDLWNLSSSLDEPISGSNGISINTTTNNTDAPSTTNTTTTRALNKLKWSLDGRRVAVGSGDQLHILGMAEEVFRPKGDEEARMMSQLHSRGILDA